MTAVSKKFVAGLLIFAFVGSVLLSIQFMKQSNKETFANANANAKAGVTRSSECNCLPGYVASKNNTTSIYFCQSLRDTNKIRKCY